MTDPLNYYDVLRELVTDERGAYPAPGIEAAINSLEKADGRLRKRIDTLNAEDTKLAGRDGRASRVPS